MANPPKKKGTTEESAFVKDWNTYFGGYIHKARRMPASSVYDIEVDGFEYGDRPAIDVLATRADRGERLVTLRFTDFLNLYGGYDHEIEPPVLHVEVKRYARFATNTIFEKKFGKRK